MKPFHYGQILTISDSPGSIVKKYTNTDCSAYSHMHRCLCLLSFICLSNSMAPVFNSDFLLKVCILLYVSCCCRQMLLVLSSHPFIPRMWFASYKSPFKNIYVVTARGLKQCKKGMRQDFAKGNFFRIHTLDAHGLNEDFDMKVML